MALSISKADAPLNVVATARCFEVPLISRDRKIQLSGLQTVW